MGLAPTNYALARSSYRPREKVKVPLVEADSTQFKVTSVSENQGYLFVQNSAMINIPIFITSPGYTMATPQKNRPYASDPELSAMSTEQIQAAIKASFGSWVGREDITDDWLEQLRNESDQRLRDLYGSEDIA